MYVQQIKSGKVRAWQTNYFNDLTRSFYWETQNISWKYSDWKITTKVKNFFRWIIFQLSTKSKSCKTNSKYIWLMSLILIEQIILILMIYQFEEFCPTTLSYNKNLILTSIWNWSLSSYVLQTSNQSIINKSTNSWNNDLNKLSMMTEQTQTSSNGLPDKKYNWLESAFYTKWNVELAQYR